MSRNNPVFIDPTHRPVAAVSCLSQQSAQRLSQLVQQNHDQHHLFYNSHGFHNHLNHLLLTTYALGAPPEQLERHYAHNAQYQRSPIRMNPLLHNMDHVRNYEKFMASLTKDGLYQEFLSFFEEQVAIRGYRAVLDEYLFADDARADAMWTRLFASILHPMIHFGLAIEFNIPIVIAEGLAWAAVHEDDARPLLEACRTVLVTTPGSNISLIDIYCLIQDQAATLRNIIEYGNHDPNYIDRLLRYNNGVLVELISRYRVSEENVEERIFEAMNVQAFVCLASQRRPYVPKMNFCILHTHNATVYLQALQRALPHKQTARLVESQIRCSLFEFVKAGVPAFDMEYVREFVADPSKQNGRHYKSWDELFIRARSMDDDGHVPKSIRALKAAEEAAGRQCAFPEPLAKHEFLDMAGVLMRSVEHEADFIATRGPTRQWLHTAAFSDPWARIEKLH